MVMQITCNALGCVPLETLIVVVFPRILEEGSDTNHKQLMHGIKESKGGSYKTKILLPMNEVTKDDVLDALPPTFLGGKKTMENLCYRIRDVVFGQISQVV